MRLALGVTLSFPQRIQGEKESVELTARLKSITHEPFSSEAFFPEHDFSHAQTQEQ